jgi:hypothetical protein
MKQLSFSFDGARIVSDIILYDSFQIKISETNGIYMCFVDAFNEWLYPSTVFEWMMYQIQRKIDIFTGKLVLIK